MVPLPQVYYAMLAYQKKHKVVNNCMTNAQFYYDCVKHNHPELNPKVQAVIAMTNTAASIHLIVRIGDEVVDPSYEIVSSGPVKYYESYGDFKKVGRLSRVVDENGVEKDDKWWLQTFLKFLVHAEKMNGGELRIVDKAFYDSQADWVISLPHQNSSVCSKMIIQMAR